MTRVAPRADAERVAEFLRGLYQEVRIEEAAERERLLGRGPAAFRGERPASRLTPTHRRGARRGLGRQPQVGGRRRRVDGPRAWRFRAPAELRPGAVAAAGHGGRPGRRARQRVAARLRLARSHRVSARRPRPARRRAPMTTPGAASRSQGARARRRRNGRRPSWVGSSTTAIGSATASARAAWAPSTLAEHVEIGKTVAVKILRRQFSGDKQLVERFRREARAASRVGHPHIIEVTDFGTTEDGCAYFVMEHLEGMDLADVLAREGRSSRRGAMRIAIQICQALRRGAHRRHHPPRPQARERVPGGARRAGRLRQGPGLRHRAQYLVRGLPTDEPRHDHGHAGIHGARAGAGAPGRRAAPTSTRSAR